ncbi:MAG: hypothetical protein HYR91_13775 [Flavobacteriia bacterium]|nr:hypothetical protein [Flavobacteriia bacterium]
MNRIIIVALFVMTSVYLFSQDKVNTNKKEIAQKESVKKKNDSQKIKPYHYVSKVKLKTKKTATYYALSDTKKTEIKITGPGVLEVLLRVRLVDTLTKSKSYYITYCIDNSKVMTKKIPSALLSKKTVYTSKINGKPSIAKKIKIKIPSGVHRISFLKARTKQKIHSHYTFKSQKELQWTPVSPMVKLENVNIKYLDKNSTLKVFNRISKEKKFVFETKDSMQLKILIKAELTTTINSNSPIYLELKEGDKILKTYKVTGKISKKTEYLDEKKLIAGNTNVIYVNVPKGKHQYEFNIVDEKKSALILVYSGLPIKKV